MTRTKGFGSSTLPKADDFVGGKETFIFKLESLMDKYLLFLVKLFLLAVPVAFLVLILKLI